MERYGAKRHAVRVAFAALESRGLLVRQPNRGVEVIQYTPDQVDELYEIRLVLERAAATRTILPVARSITKELERVAKKHRKAVQERRYADVFLLNREFHRVQFTCCGNEQLFNLIEEHARLVEPVRVVKYEDDDHMATIIQQHFDIIEAMKSDSVKAYVGATADHLPASAKAYRVMYERRFGAIERVTS
jgi:DNA-binding GntR family transcriptional regulator